jgi:hypothetical protein
MHVPTCDALKQEFMAKYTKDFQITGGGLMEASRSSNQRARYRDVYTLTTTFGRTLESLDEYKEFSTKSLRPKQVPIQPGLILETAQLFQIQGGRSFIDPLSLNFNSLQHGFVSTFHLQWHSWLASVHPLHRRVRRSDALGCCASSDEVSRCAFEFQADLS